MAVGHYCTFVCDASNIFHNKTPNSAQVCYPRQLLEPTLKQLHYNTFSSLYILPIWNRINWKAFQEISYNIWTALIAQVEIFKMLAHPYNASHILVRDLLIRDFFDPWCVAMCWGNFQAARVVILHYRLYSAVLPQECSLAARVVILHYRL